MVRKRPFRFPICGQFIQIMLIWEVAWILSGDIGGTI